MYIYIYICIYIHIYIYINVYICIYVYIYMKPCTLIQVDVAPALADGGLRPPGERGHCHHLQQAFGITPKFPASFRIDRHFQQAFGLTPDPHPSTLTFKLTT